MKTILLAALAIALPGLAASANFEFTNGTFQVTGITPGLEPPAGWQSVFAVYITDSSVPAMLGTYQALADRLVFIPRFPVKLGDGLPYHVVFKGAGGPKEWDLKGTVLLPASSTHVAQVYPTIDILPTNQLKFYLYFSAPMQRGGVWQHIRLLDEHGQKVNLAFLEIDQELWDAGNRRLTVLFDPGRIKRGVKPQMDTGSAIVEGHHYTLVIDKELRDAQGAELTASFRKEFRVGPALRSGIDLKEWKLTAPTPGSRTPLQIDFPRPLDQALLEHVLHVEGSAGEVPGSFTVDAHETRWRFTPLEPWQEGSFRLVIDMTLEDLAGNRIGRPFDVDLVNNPAARITASTTTLLFDVGRASAGARL